MEHTKGWLSWADFKAEAVSRLTGAVLASAIAVALGLWTVYRETERVLERNAGWTLPLLPYAFAVLALFVVAAVMGASWAVWSLSEQAATRRRSHRTPGQIKRQIVDWLLENGFEVKFLPEVGVEFMIAATQTDKADIYPVNLFKHPGSRWITLTTNLTLRADHRAPIAALGDRFLRLMGIELAKLGVEYGMGGSEDDKTTLQVIQFSKKFRLDAETDDLALLEAMGALIRGARVADNMIVLGLKPSASDSVAPPPPEGAS